MYYFKVLNGRAVRLEDSEGNVVSEELVVRPFYMASSFLKDVVRCAGCVCDASLLRFNHKSGHLLIVDAEDVEIVATTVALSDIQKREAQT